MQRPDDTNPSPELNTQQGLNNFPEGNDQEKSPEASEEKEKKNTVEKVEAEEELDQEEEEEENEDEDEEGEMDQEEKSVDENEQLSESKKEPSTEEKQPAEKESEKEATPAEFLSVLSKGEETVTQWLIEQKKIPSFLCNVEFFNPNGADGAWTKLLSWFNVFFFQNNEGQPHYEIKQLESYMNGIARVMNFMISQNRSALISDGVTQKKFADLTLAYSLAFFYCNHAPEQCKKSLKKKLTSKAWTNCFNPLIKHKNALQILAQLAPILLSQIVVDRIKNNDLGNLEYNLLPAGLDVNFHLTLLQLGDQPYIEISLFDFLVPEKKYMAQALLRRGLDLLEQRMKEKGKTEIGEEQKIVTDLAIRCLQNGVCSDESVIRCLRCGIRIEGTIEKIRTGSVSVKVSYRPSHFAFDTVEKWGSALKDAESKSNDQGALFFDLLLAYHLKKQAFGFSEDPSPEEKAFEQLLLNDYAPPSEKIGELVVRSFLKGAFYSTHLLVQKQGALHTQEHFKALFSYAEFEFKSTPLSNKPYQSESFRSLGHLVVFIRTAVVIDESNCSDFVNAAITCGKVGILRAALSELLSDDSSSPTLLQGVAPLQPLDSAISSNLIDTMLLMLPETDPAVRINSGAPVERKERVNGWGNNEHDTLEDKKDEELELVLEISRTSADWEEKHREELDEGRTFNSIPLIPTRPIITSSSSSSSSFSSSLSSSSSIYSDGFDGVDIFSTAVSDNKEVKGERDKQHDEQAARLKFFQKQKEDKEKREMALVLKESLITAEQEGHGEKKNFVPIDGASSFEPYDRKVLVSNGQGSGGDLKEVKGERDKQHDEQAAGLEFFRKQKEAKEEREMALVLKESLITAEQEGHGEKKNFVPIDGASSFEPYDRKVLVSNGQGSGDDLKVAERKGTKRGEVVNVVDEDEALQTFLWESVHQTVAEEDEDEELKRVMRESEEMAKEAQRKKDQNDISSSVLQQTPSSSTDQINVNIHQLSQVSKNTELETQNHSILNVGIGTTSTSLSSSSTEQVSSGPARLPQVPESPVPKSKGNETRIDIPPVTENLTSSDTTSTRTETNSKEKEEEKEKEKKDESSGLSLISPTQITPPANTAVSDIVIVHSDSPKENDYKREKTIDTFPVWQRWWILPLLGMAEGIHLGTKLLLPYLESEGLAEWGAQIIGMPGSALCGFILGCAVYLGVKNHGEALKEKLPVFLTSTPVLIVLFTTGFLSPHIAVECTPILLEHFPVLRDYSGATFAAVILLPGLIAGVLAAAKCTYHYYQCGEFALFPKPKSVVSSSTGANIHNNSSASSSSAQTFSPSTDN